MVGFLDRMDGENWAHFLENIGGEDAAASTKGVLEVSDAEVKVRVLSEGGDFNDVTLSDIIEVSKKKLEEIRIAHEEAEGVGLTGKKIQQGLVKLDERLRKILEEKGRAKAYAYDIFNFEDDLQQVLNEKGEKDERTLLMEIAYQSKVTKEDFTKILDIVHGDPKFLFHLTSYDESFFDLTKETASAELRMELAKTVLENFGALEPAEKEKFLSALFERNPQNVSLFSLLVGADDSGKVSGHILRALNEDFLNNSKNLDCKRQVLNHAFSAKRYEQVFLQEDNLPPESSKKVKDTSEQYKLDMASFSEEGGSLGPSPSYRSWQNEMMGSSTTIASGSSEGKRAREGWLTAHRQVIAQAVSDRGTERRVDFEFFGKIHKSLADGEVENPGKIRSTIVRTSGGWGALYPPPQYLERLMPEFFDWFNKGLLLCESGSKNPLIFAAEVYQRIVSLHPFENGNGRACRLLMDYVLIRFSLPPPLLGKDVNVAVFPLKDAQISNEEVVNKILSGVMRSFGVLFSMGGG